jgi:hypothetical protein
MDGGFVLKLPTLQNKQSDLGKKEMTSSGRHLEISYIGYLTQELKVGNQANLQITLKEDLQNLEEVVVVGYGAQKKVNMTGAVSSLDLNLVKGDRSTHKLVSRFLGY